MSFVELNRWFAPVQKDREVDPDFDFIRFWGPTTYGWLDWEKLLTHRRVVVLAEASSGKTEEFRNRTSLLGSDGKAAFYVRVEELVDQGLEGALGFDDAIRFEQWKAGTDAGWFFLDSVDEARLNRKSFATALKRFAKDCASALDRAHVYVSCRAFIWDDRDDRRAIEEHIRPASKRPEVIRLEDKEKKLLAPIFDDGNTDRNSSDQSQPSNIFEQLVVRLVPLNRQMAADLAARHGAVDAPEFSKAIDIAGLENMAQRPGDVLDMVAYWLEHRQLGSVAQMTEFSVQRKLLETNQTHARLTDIRLDRARLSAERLAAALTFGKSFSLKAPSENDPGLTSGAIDPVLVLEDLTAAERDALLMRALFAPSTYGRIRFHHRSAQEYLTARWLDRLLTNGCPVPEIWRLIFVEKYGVETIAPSLRATAAWLAQWHQDFCDEIIRREPMVLLQHGDPRSLSIDCRRRILASLAEKHRAGEVTNASFDHRNLILFADERLAHDIAKAWTINDREDFRFLLLRLIRDGAITGCEEILRSVVENEQEHDYHRILALNGIVACRDIEGIRWATERAASDTGSMSARLAAGFAMILFPAHIGVEELIALIEHSQPPKPASTDGFRYEISSLFERAPVFDRPKLAEAIGKLIFRPPFKSEYKRISAKFGFLAKEIGPALRTELSMLRDRDPPEGLIKLLMAFERNGENWSSSDKTPTISELVRANPRVNRALFWTDVAEVRESERAKDREIIRPWQIYLGTQSFWAAGEKDLDWLLEDAATRGNIDDRRIAFCMAFGVVDAAGRPDSSLERLRQVATSDPLLQQDLNGYSAPRVESTEDQRYRKEHEADQRKFRAREERDKESWREFGRSLQSDPGILKRGENLKDWKSGIHRLEALTRWLKGRIRSHRADAARQWRFLEEGFSRQVAEAYRDGMIAVWRNVQPVRPDRKPGGMVTTSRLTLLAFGGIGIESAETPDWPEGLTDTDAALAARHGCLTEECFPDWMDRLVSAHPLATIPVLHDQIEREWAATGEGSSYFLYHYASNEVQISRPIQDLIADSIINAEAGSTQSLERATEIISKFDIGFEERHKLSLIFERRFQTCKNTDKEDFALGNLGLLFLLSPAWGLQLLQDWIGLDQPAPGVTRAARILGRLFDSHHRGVALPALGRADVLTLEGLVRLAYQHVRPEDDIRHEGTYTPDLRDYAEGARGSILSSLLNRPGEEAYRSVSRLAKEALFSERLERFHELARAKAEQDSERPAWTPEDTKEFERSHLAPVKTGDDLFHVILGVLADINFHLHNNDVSSRALLQRAGDENEVRNYLMEQMDLRSGKRFRTYREAVVADSDRPDIVVVSNTAHCELAIEVKHGGKDWSLRQLNQALRVQLSEHYLKPDTRRHGVLIISNHRSRHWIDPETGQKMLFAATVGSLASAALSMDHNSSGAIKVAVVGIDAA
ncbi:hypothetical protein [Mesorhizobium sp. LjNodule214]|uniref:hypothetical protein n=1 Tax=Mesorhizobium sp. LjNodule214 TaxID=3342252 RepID=UPI003ECFDBB3